MAEGIGEARDSLQRTLDLLRRMSGGRITQVDSTDYSIRVQKAQNILLQNEKKIWLKTKDGKEMVRRLSEASSRLLATARDLEKSSETDSKTPNDLTAALKEVELNARQMEEESRRRSMVVT